MVVPWMTLLGSIAYDEGGLLLFGTLAIGLAIRAMDEPQPVKWMAMAGVMAGFACGSKLTAGPAILLPVPIVLLITRGVHCAMRRGAIAFWIAGIVVLSPWLIRNLVWAHNPVFPEMTSVFGKAHWSDVQVQRWIKANHQPRLDQQNLRGELQAGWDQVAGDARYGYLLIPLALLIAIARRDREAIALILLLLFQAIFWMFFTHLQSRFFVLAIPVCAMIVGGTKSKEWLIALAAVVLVVASFGTYFVLQKFDAIRQRISMPIFRVAWVEQPIPLPTLPTDTGNKQVELIGDGQAFLCDVPMTRLHYRTVFDVDAEPGESAIEAWRRGWPRGDDVVTVINPEELMRFHKTYWGIPEP
jgi:4-amino-4-deoxy-L-arabinose transferase-like glycosyltransferase